MNILDWHLNTQYPPEEARAYLGRIPILISPDSEDNVRQQISDNYPDGWQPQANDGTWRLMADDILHHKVHGPCAPAALAWHRGEQVLVYPGGWVCVVQLSGEYTVVRILP